MGNDTYDYIIVGGGIGGCVVASRLREYRPKASIVLIEAGPDATNHPLVADAANAQRVRLSELNWKYPSTPQKHLGNKICENAAGKALGGGSAINSGGWIRGDASDYDAWAKAVNDRRWSYEGLLPYFRKVERYHRPDADTQEHGFNGPIHTQTATLTGRRYPLREKTKDAWAELGVKNTSDANSGSPQGLAESTEAWKDGKRQMAHVVYPLDGVQVMTETLAYRVLVEDRERKKVAIGVELADGRRLTTKGEVIVCAGAYRTPQLLLLSGIGSKGSLARHGVKQIVDSPFVGQNLHDHLMAPQFWKLRDPEQGLAVGSPQFNNPNYAKGLPLDWITTQSVPREGLRQAIETDEGAIGENHPQLDPPRSHLELYVVYAGASKDPPIPLDGSHIMTSVVGLLPTSRGTVELASKDPHDNPIIDNNYYATEHDRHVFRTGLKLISQLMTQTTQGQSMVEGETVATGLSALSPSLSNEELDARVRFGGGTLYHPAGTAAMGKVVDADLRVKGVHGLRVADASVLPLPIAAHYQACVFALGEQAADILLQASNASLA